jgi:hypothetical protein
VCAESWTRAVPTPTVQSSDYPPGFSLVAVRVLDVAGVAAGHPVALIHAQIGPQPDADLVPYQHRWRAACASPMRLEELRSRDLVGGVIAALARRWPFPVAGAGMLAAHPRGNDATA